jgi:hypothetical protein
MSCNPINFSQHFGGTCRLLPREKRPWIKLQAQLTLQPWKLRRYVPPKLLSTFAGLHSVVIQKIELIITAMRTSNHAFWNLIGIPGEIDIMTSRSLDLSNGSTMTMSRLSIINLFHLPNKEFRSLRSQWRSCCLRNPDCAVHVVWLSGEATWCLCVLRREWPE